MFILLSSLAMCSQIVPEISLKKLQYRVNFASGCNSISSVFRGGCGSSSAVRGCLRFLAAAGSGLQPPREASKYSLSGNVYRGLIRLQIVTIYFLILIHQMMCFFLCLVLESISSHAFL